MKANVGTIDRILRGVLGAALLLVAVLGDGPIRWLGLAGVVLIATGAVRFCPLYAVLGVNTCPAPTGTPPKS